MFKDLQKLVQYSEQEQKRRSNKEIERLQDKPFWICMFQRFVLLL
jgi:hypothetical protein